MDTHPDLATPALDAAKPPGLDRSRPRRLDSPRYGFGPFYHMSQPDEPAPDPFRVYANVGPDGYPPEWHATIKHLVREQAGHRCVRCGHPYRNGQHGNGEWSPCDDGCDHGGPFHIRSPGDFEWVPYDGGAEASTLLLDPPFEIEAEWRILTVHHLNGDKADCRWWNLAALCQRCHLRIQRTVLLERVWPWPHSDWFQPYAAGWYAHAYLGENLTRDETMERLEELLALERIA